MSSVENCDESISNSQTELGEKAGGDELEEKVIPKENGEKQPDLLENHHENGINGDIADSDGQKDEPEDSKEEIEEKNSVLLTVNLPVKSEKCEDEEEEKPVVDIHPENINGDDNAVDIEMNASVYENKDEVENDPNFAVICSFLDKFGEALEIKYSIRQLKLMFEDYTKVRPDLIDLHIKLLRKRRKYINKEKWEKALVKFCLEYSVDDSWELERGGYRNTKLALRLRIFVRLLEAMFDYNQKFKADLNSNSEASSLRLQSFGRDITGYSYWYQVDNDLDFRLYKEEPDEDGSWSLVSKNLSELNEYIVGLEQKSVEDIKLVSSISNSDESNSNQALILLMKSNEELVKSKVNQEEEEEEDGRVDVEEKAGEELESEEKMETQVSKVKEEPEEEKEQVFKTLAGDVKPTVGNEEDDTKDIFQQVNRQKEHHKDVESQDNTAQQTEISLSSSEHEIKLLYEDLMKQIEEDVGEAEDEEESSCKTRRTVSTSRRGRGKRRGRYRRTAPTRKTQSKLEETSTKEFKEEDESQEESEKSQSEKPRVLESKKPPASESEKSSQTPKGRGRKRRSELDKLKEDFADGLAAKRCSRRIQVLQEKKLVEMQEEQKRIEKEMLEKKRKKEAAQAARAAAALAASLACDQSDSESSESDHKTRKCRKRRKKVESDDDYNKESDDEEAQLESKKKRKRRRRKGKRKRGNNPWEDSEDSEDHNAMFEDDYDDILEEDDNEVLKFDNDNEDEFACEEIDPNAEPVIVRRARTVKRSKEDIGESEELVVNDDKPCGRCGKYDNPQWILLCDKCDAGYHTSCLRPPMFIIPTGDWYCPPCEHVYLIEKLRLESKRLSDEIERREEEKLQQRKRWKFAHCEISAENILNEGGVVEEGEAEDEVVPKKKSTLRKRNRKRNGFAKDEIEEAIDEFEDPNSSDEQSDESDEDSSGSDSSGSTRSSDELEDEIGQALFHDHQRPPGKKRKERHIDVNDYSRSGLKLRAARKRKPISYIFKEYDDMIKSAILVEEDEVAYEEEEPGSLPRSKGKDISNILRANAELPDFSVNPFEDRKDTDGNDVTDGQSKSANEEPPLDESHQLPGEENDEEDEMVVKKSNKKQKKKLTNLDFSTEEEEDHASDDDFRLADDDDDIDEEVTEVEDNEDDDTINESDEDFVASRRRSSRTTSRHSGRSSRRSRKKKSKKKSRKRSRGRSRGFINDSEEEEMSTDEDNGSYNSESSSDYEPRSRKRAAATKRVSYREDSSTEEEPAKNADDDEDFDEEDDEEGYYHKTKVTKSARESKPPIKWTYAKSSKKRKIIDDDDDNDDNEEEEDKTEERRLPNKKCKTESESLVPDDLAPDESKESKKGSESSGPAKLNQASTSAIDAKADDKIVEHPQPTAALQNAPVISDSSFPSTYSVPPVDPLSSMKEMNSKLDYLSGGTPISSGAATLPKSTSISSSPLVAYSNPSPVAPPASLHPYQSAYPPYRPPPPVSTTGYPPVPPGAPPHSPHYSLPPHQSYPGHRAPPPNYPGQSPGVSPHSAHYMPPQSPIRPHNAAPYQMVVPPNYPGQPHHPSVPPPPGGEKTDDEYTLTNLDSCKPNRSPATPSSSAPPATFAPPGPPPSFYPGPYENHVRPPPNYSHYPPQPHHHPPAPPGSPGYYGGPPHPAYHPYGPAYPQTNPHIASPLSHYPPPRPSPSASPAYPQGNPVSTVANPMPPRHPMPPRMPGMAPPSPYHPPGVPPPPYSYPYPPSSGPPGQSHYSPSGPNGDFTIQNLLHTQQSDPVCAVKSTPKTSKDPSKATKSKAKTEFSSVPKAKSTKGKKTKAQSASETSAAT